LSHADLLSNASLATADNALVFASLFPTPDVLELAGGLTGAGTESPFQALGNAKLGLLLLELALLLLVFYWMRGIAFGRLQDRSAGSRRQFSEHVSTLGQVLARAKAGGHALANYAAWALERLHERIRPGTRMSVIQLSEAIARRTGKTQAEVLRVLAEAASAREAGTGTANTKVDLETLKALEALVLEAGGVK
jgi:hypothetical protein